MRTEQEYRNLEAENTRLTADVERLTKERDEARRTVKMAHEEGTRQIATLQARIDELEAEPTIVSKMKQLCEQSLDPETFTKWEQVKSVLFETRRAFKTGDKS